MTKLVTTLPVSSKGEKNTEDTKSVETSGSWKSIGELAASLVQKVAK